MSAYFSAALILLILGVGVLTAEGQGRELGIEIALRNGEVPLMLEQKCGEDAGGRGLSVTRFDMLLSELALRRSDGSWLDSSEWYAVVSAGGGRTRSLATGVPAERFTAVRFSVGLNEEVNHSDPNNYAVGHALHPQMAGLHWGWQGGYIFMALEGHWQQEDGRQSGFSWHLATDAMKTVITLPVELDMSRVRSLAVGLDVGALTKAVDLVKQGAASHSRPGDAVAAVLQGALFRAFSVRGTATDRFQELPAKPQPGVVRVGTPYDLAISSRLPKATLPQDNPLTVEGVELGRRLFHERALSASGAVACASCHQAASAFADGGRALSAGHKGRIGQRNAMPLFNLAWYDAFFWDGRVKTLREQVLHPISDPREMALPLDKATAVLSQEASYRAGFKQAFGDEAVTNDRIARALEQHLLTLVAQDAKFDRAARGEATLTGEERRGLELFVTEYDPKRGLRGADCFHCHSGNLFTNGQFASNGLDLLYKDQGRAGVTGAVADAGKFRVPSLRNVALTAPYMHDGRFASLEDVVAHYDHGVKATAALDPNLAKHPATGLGLSAADQRAIVAFLHTLTDHTLTKESKAQASR